MPDDHTAAGLRRRTQILDTAAHVLATEGLDGFAMRAIATELEISLGNLQYYFPTRDDLLEAVIRDQFAKDLGVIETSRGDWARAFGDLIERWQGPTGAVFLSLSLLAGRSQQFAMLHHDIYASFIDTLVGGLPQTLERRDARRRARLATALIDGMAIQLRPSGGPSRRDRIDVIRGAVDLAVAVLSSDAETTSVLPNGRSGRGRDQSGRRV